MNSMKALVFEAPQTVVWRDIEPPICPQPYGAVLRPLIVAPCTSDVHTVYGGGKPKMNPHVIGHECVAEVVSVGAEVADFSPGDRVAVPAITPNWRALGIQEGNFKHAEAPFSGHLLGRTIPGVFAEFFSVPDADTTLAHIPPGVTLEQALLCADVVTTGFTGAEHAEIKMGDRVCVMGIGAIGLMAICGASLLGASEIYAVGSRPASVPLAKRFGASEVINYREQDPVQAIEERTEGKGVDAVILCGGSDEVLAQAVDMVRYGIGTISNVNYFGGEGFLPFPKFSGGRGMAGKTLHTELAAGGRVRMERLMRMIGAGRFDPSPLITHRYHGLENVGPALGAMRDKGDTVIKIAVTNDENAG